MAREKAKLGPNYPDTLVSMINVARSLVALNRLPQSVAIIDECLRSAEGKAVDPRLMPYVLDLRLRAFAKQKDGMGCRQTAEMWETINRTDANSLYSAACFRAVTAGVLRSDDRTPDASKRAEAEADRAMSWLAKAVAAGFYTPQRLALMNRDSNLNPLRDRADFRRLLAELVDQGFPKDPFAR